MLHPAWIERGTPLARCPRKACRRSGVCEKETGPLPCERTHETKDAMRIKLARKFQKWNRQLLRENPELKNQVLTPYELELKLKYVKELLQARDEASQPSRLAAQQQKPARAGKSGTRRAVERQA